MSDPTQLPKAERLKKQSRFLRGTIPQDLSQRTDDFGRDNTPILKFHGIYQQDDRDARKRSSGRDKSYSFMVRTKVPGGKITARQLLTELDLAERYGNATLRVTTRQGFQLHGVLKAGLKPVMRSVNEALMTTLGACGDVERNVMSCPAPHHHDRVHDRMQATADAISQHLRPQSRAYYEIWLNGEQVNKQSVGPDVEPIYGDTYLPRKFKTGIALPEDNCIDVYTQDIGLLAIVDRGELIGYNVLVGGGMGTSPASQDTFPRLADALAFVPYDEVLAVVTAIVKVQRDYGNRANRRRARLKYLVHDWGVPRFKSIVEQYLGRQELEPPYPVETYGYQDHLGWHPQGDGKFYWGIYLENGRVKDTAEMRLKTGLRTIFERFHMPARLTPQQSILLCDLEPEWQDEILSLLQKHGIRTQAQISHARRYAMACPALPTCGLAIAEAERVMPSVVDELEAEIAKLGLDAAKFTVRMTGCPNGCARPYTADIGLVGQTVGKYKIFVGGGLVGTRLGFMYRELVPLDAVVAELRPLLVYYKTDGWRGESLGEFCHRKGLEDLHGFEASYRQRHRQSAETVGADPR